MRLLRTSLIALSGALIVLGCWMAVQPVSVAQDGSAVPAASPARSAAAERSAAPAEAAARSQPSFGLDRLSALSFTLGGYPAWQYLASLIWVFMAVMVSALIDFLMTHQLRRWAQKTRTELDDKLLEILHTPVKLAVFLVMLNIGIHMFVWPEWAEQLLATLFTVAVAATLIYLAMRLVDLLMNFVESKFFADDSQMAKLVTPVLAKSLKVFVLVIGALTAAQYLGLPIASVIAGLGIGGVAVALAAQNTLANLFGTISILADRPFRVGDRVQIDKYDGPVETIGLRSTRIRTLDGYLVTIPNKIVADSAITNVSMRPTIRQNITVSLTYDTPAERVQEAVAILRDVMLKHPLTHDAWINWRDYGPHSLDIFIIYWCKSTDYRQFLQAMEDMNVEVKRRFDAAALDFAFPTQTIHLRHDAPPESVGREPA